MRPIPKRDQELRHIVKSMRPGYTLSGYVLEEIKRACRPIKRMFERKVKKHGLGFEKSEHSLPGQNLMKVVKN